ncbi:sulfite exporter TauE/SafE family protein [Aquibium sp. A9E412]|uniref:sulfite exporter TauE/SafE family protein n=1 Tax=Aquibium sp. A9E412 TaxID=2976767 RepID=UPI0025B19C14|nr:sulfite exporter TauE/SafE family protein [Aquibium sp. A9E412]MDN2568241.1 sulfite exporter TauE/SafE family protein [Aquibium sp. A9E412]
MELPWSEIAAFAAALAVAGVVAGFLAGVFGIGGGAILVPVFYQVFVLLDIDESVRVHLAVGTSLAVIVPTSLRSFQAHYRRGAVDMAVLRSFVVSVPAGVVLGSLVAASVSGAGLRAIFAAIAFAVGLRLLLNRESWQLGSELPANPLRGAIGLVIGFLSTLMGIGGGVLNNTFMTLYGRPMHQAVATSAGVGVLISIPGLFGYMWAGWGDPALPIASTGFINWIAVIIIIPVTLIVAPLGASVAHALSRRQLEIGFGLFLLVVSARFVWSLF